MKQISLMDLMDILNYGDIRGVRGWCNKNDVTILKQGKNEFVFESNFKEAFEKPFINKLKTKFGNEWQEVYRLYEEGNIPALNILNSPVINAVYSAYKPDNSTSAKYLEKFKNQKKHKNHEKNNAA